MEPLIESAIEAPGFSVRTGHYLGHASLAAYGEPAAMAERLGLAGRLRPFACGEFRGFLGLADELTLVAFRGTKTVGNFLADAQTLLVPHGDYPGRVHLGFAEALDALWPELRRRLPGPSRSPPLWLTGHSLGGALATLASFRLAADGFAVRAVYTYGSPRPGDRQFHRRYKLANYRFVNDRDLIPHLPFRWCYKHVGALKLLTSDGDLLDGPAAWRDKKHELTGQAKHVQRMHRRANPTLLEIEEPDWLADHNLHRYLEAIAGLLPRVPRRRRVDGPSGPGPAQRIARSHDMPSPLRGRDQQDR